MNAIFNAVFFLYRFLYAQPSLDTQYLKNTCIGSCFEHPMKSQQLMLLLELQYSIP